MYQVITLYGLSEMNESDFKGTGKRNSDNSYKIITLPMKQYSVSKSRILIVNVSFTH